MNDDKSYDISIPKLNDGTPVDIMPCIGHVAYPASEALIFRLNSRSHTEASVSDVCGESCGLNVQLTYSKSDGLSTFMLYNEIFDEELRKQRKFYKRCMNRNALHKKRHKLGLK